MVRLTNKAVAMADRTLRQSRSVVTTLITYFLLLTTCFACSNFETSGNGDFDGYWQLEEIDTLATGRTTDMHDSLVFWAVQHHLIELCCRQEDPVTFSYKHFSVFYHFERTDDTLHFLADTLSQKAEWPVLDLRAFGDPRATLEQVRVYGFTRCDETFRVLHLDADKMALESEAYRLHFRKY